MTAPKLIYILVSAADWERFEGWPEYTASSLAAEGFLHASQSAEQLLWSANRRYLDAGRVLVLCIDESRISAEVRYEHAGSQPDPFPHIYGPLNTDAIDAVRELEREGSGRFVGWESLLL